MPDATEDLIADLCALIMRAAPYDADWPDLRDRVEARSRFTSEFWPVRLNAKQQSLLASLVRGAQKDVDRMAGETPWVEWAGMRMQLVEVLDVLTQDDDGGEF